MATRKPKIEYYWTTDTTDRPVHVVNWRLVGANGETMCQSNQGFRDKTDAQRSVVAVSDMFGGVELEILDIREVGPGRKPA